MSVQRRLSDVVQSSGFRLAVMALIVINAAAIGLDTYPSISQRWGGSIGVLDRVILAIFTLEIVLRFLAAESKRTFFRDPWQWLDIVVVSVGYIPATSFVTVFRLARVLRILHSLAYMPSLQRIVRALLHTLPSLGNVLTIMGLIFYVFGVMGTYLFGQAAPERFGTLQASFLTLFEVVTLSNWQEVMHQIIPTKPYAWAYFVGFILVGTFFALNACISILISNMSFLVDDSDMARVEAALKRLEQKVDRLAGGSPGREA